MSGSTRFDDGSQGEKDVGVDFTGRASFLVSSSSSSSSSSPVFSVWIVNKSGGLIFYKNYSSDKNTLDINDTLRLASVWHSLHAISRTNSVSPVKKVQESSCWKRARLICTALKRKQGLNLWSAA